MAFYTSHKETFENENDFVLLGVRSHNGIFQPNFLHKIDSLTGILDSVSGIKKVFSPTSLFTPVRTHLGGMRLPLIHLHDTAAYAQDRRRVYQSGRYVGSFFAADTLSVSLLMRKSGGLSRAENTALLGAIQNAAGQLDFEEYHLAGRIHTQHYYINEMRRQMGLFAGLAALLFLASLYLLFRQWQYMVLAFLTVSMSLIWIFGLMGFLSLKVDLMLTLLPALIFVIGTSNGIHLLSHFQQYFFDGTAKHLAIARALKETTIPNALSAFTTALGFASLVALPVPLVQQFGIVAAVGVLLAFMANLLLVPVALRALPLRPARSLKGRRGGNMARAAQRFYKTHAKRAILGFALVSCVAVALVPFLTVNNYFLDDLDSNSYLKEDLDFFENHFSGIRPFEINVRAVEGREGLLQLDALLELQQVEGYLSKQYGVGFLLSPTTFIKQINQALHAGRSSYYRLPQCQKGLEKILRIAKRERVWERYIPVLAPEKGVGRISGKVKDEGSHVWRSRNRALRSFLENNTKLLDFQVTGAAHLMDNANRQIARHLALGIFIALGVGTAVIGIFTASARMALLSLLVNSFPLLLVAAIMAVSGISLKVSTSLIFTIAYGIAVDDTIHFLSAYKRQMQSQRSVAEALEQTIMRLWRPMLFTSLVLLAGFLIFSLSVFKSIASLGALVSLSLIVALFSDFYLLPALLRYYPDSMRRYREKAGKEFS